MPDERLGEEAVGIAEEPTEGGMGRGVLARGVEEVAADGGDKEVGMVCAGEAMAMMRKQG